MLTAAEAKKISDEFLGADIYELIRVYATKGAYSLFYNKSLPQIIENDLISKGFLVITGTNSANIIWS